MGKEKEANLSANTSQNFALVCMRLGFHGFNISYFVVCFNAVESIVF